MIRLHPSGRLNLELRGVPDKLPKGSKITLVGLSTFDWDPDWKAPKVDLVGTGRRPGKNRLRFVQRNLARGRWRLNVEIPGFKPEKREFQVDGTPESLNVRLRRQSQ
ncbi:MAG: hypothetical protein KDB61_09550 [Planctomycetes bacterium]|nr:hypothetical protein [Planctomycetota bacterium]